MAALPLPQCHRPRAQHSAKQFTNGVRAHAAIPHLFADERAPRQQQHLTSSTSSLRGASRTCNTFVSFASAQASSYMGAENTSVNSSRPTPLNQSTGV